MRLTTQTHDRDAAGLKYVYPVVSRRAGGVSIGINLNTNNACNWRCAYCQVPDLTRGSAPELDLELLERELGTFLHDVVRGDYMERHVPQEARRLNDVALSGNGEPTTSTQLPEVMRLIGRVLTGLDLAGKLNVVLISNGSLVHKPWVQTSLELLAGLNGEMWFKLDSATSEGRKRMNDTDLGTERVEANLRSASALCRTRIQTCVLGFDGEPPSNTERAAYIALLERVRAAGATIHDVLMYGLERVSHQPEAARLGKLDAATLESFADEIRATGLAVSVHP